jgi:PTH1 family peptidyl-tRNA hydrolase
MKLIVGLGNPGKEYQASRHNIGFSLLDVLADRWSIALTRHKHQGLCGNGLRAGEQVVLLKPQTYMNRSGESVAEAMSFYKATFSELLVVLDDMALPLGKLRLRRDGSAGGHNGLQNIIDRLGGNEFARLRIGIGSAAPGTAVAHVLGDFAKNEKSVIAAALGRAAEAVECWLDKGVNEAMNRYNVKEGLLDS